MISIQELHEQNHQIAELAKTLSYLLQDREMCDTSIVGELFERYRKNFKEHMGHNTAIYAVLLNSDNPTARHLAERFMEGEKEIKRLFKRYANKWWKNGLHMTDHAVFLEETEDMFELVWERIQAESEQLYPTARAA
ncbi:MAG: hypothetical protein COB59_08155 [Rhodospirillaceae bacterium]|nr:MAG: hypothetical protein COB59_08155 [Rhodospirillaceae bacterium]